MTTDQQAVTAITAGLDDASTHGLTKKYDIAINVLVALRDQGLKIVRTPRAKEAA